MPARSPLRWHLLLLGAYLTLRGYHSLDGDQAYRLPILLRWLDPSLYASDPFVRSFDAFNPHRGWLVLMATLVTVVGLSASMLLLFVGTFLGTCRGIERLTRSAWPGQASSVGLVGVGLVLVAKAGNIGTNHLFEAMLLDRLVALALGWNALSAVVERPSAGVIRSSLLLGLAAIVHPSMGLQLALLATGTWGVFALIGPGLEVARPVAVRGAALSLMAVIPGLWLNLRAGHLLTEGLDPARFWTLSVELQSPQHMLPHLWRLPQWLAAGCYLVLAVLTLMEGGRLRRARLRLVVMLGLALVWLASGWVSVELLRHTRITVFQPFRMATVARGLALVLIAGRVGRLWSRDTWLSRARCVVLATGLAGDWMLVVATVVELGSTLGAILSVARPRLRGALPWAIFGGCLAWGLDFLSRHDTDSGHRTVLMALAGWIALERIRRRIASHRPEGMTSHRFERAAFVLAWTVPVLALLAASIPVGSTPGRSALIRGLVARCRFAGVPIDDVERLSLWCRDHTPHSARFIGPPGPKTFRLWSQRSLAFNRAGSPYHAAGLDDWFGRFRDHVGSDAPPEAFAKRYQSARHQVESGYDRMDVRALAALARRQGADHVMAASPDHWKAEGDPPTGSVGPLKLLHTEGRLAVYRVVP